MSTLLIDCETYSELDVTEVGGHIYAAHPSTEVIFWSVRSPDWPVSLVFEEPNLWHLLRMLKETNRIKWTKNEALDLISWGDFDRLIAQHTPLIASVKDRTWSDLEPGFISGPNNTFWANLQDVSLIYGGPDKLKYAAEWWAGHAPGKTEGKHLINYFCKPNKEGMRMTEDDDPVKWAEFRAYASRDTEVMVPILDRFVSYAEEGGEALDAHWDALRVVGRMNERGVPIDRTSCAIAKSFLESKELTARSRIEEVYGFSPTQVGKVKEFLETENCQKETLEALLDTEADVDKVEVARARLLVSGAARKKLAPMLRMSVDDDPSVRGAFVYHGAWTRRLSSRGIQGQNFVRSKSDEAFFSKLQDLTQGFGPEIFDEVRSNIRGFIQAPEGKTLCASDYSAVELRVGAWLAGETSLLHDFIADEDPYLKMASKLYGQMIVDKEAPERQVGKTVELAAIYQLSGTGLAMQAATKDFSLVDTLTPLRQKMMNNRVDRLVRDGTVKPEDAAFAKEIYAGDEVIAIYRDTRSKIVDAWGDCQECFHALIDETPGAYIEWGQVRFERWEDFIKVVRPSGFAQYYWTPQVTVGQWPDGGKKTNLNFVGRLKSGGMGWKSTYGGDIFQSLCQGTAADLILHGMENVEAHGFLPVMSIHDEVVTLIDDCKEDRSKELSELLCQLPGWAEGLPIKAEGWQQRRFTK